MELTKAQSELMKLLYERNKNTLLSGKECLSARTLKKRGLVSYEGVNHYRITPAGRAALEDQ